MTKANKTKRAKHHTENYNGKQHPDLGQMWPCASDEVPYLGPEGGRPGKAYKAVRHACPGNWNN